MNSRAAVMMVLAILSGLGAMYGARKMMARGAATEAAAEVLVAARDIQVEEVLKADMVQVVKMPRSAVPAGSSASFKTIEARWARMPLLAGEPILEAKLAPRDAPVGLLARIPAGMRAFAVEVNEQSGVSGFILPEHRVDVILARNRREGEGKPESETVLQDVLVLAAGTTTARPEDRSIQVRTVTLALKPDQVNVLVASRTEGNLSLALRGHNDHEVVPRAAPAAGPRSGAPEPARPVVVPAAAPVVVVPPPAPPLPTRRIVIWHGPRDTLEEVALGGAPERAAVRIAGGARTGTDVTAPLLTQAHPGVRSAAATAAGALPVGPPHPPLP